MKNHKSLSLIIIVLIVVAFFAGGILTWQYFARPKEEMPKEKVPTGIIKEEKLEIGSSAVWKPSSKEWFKKWWHGCESLNCFFSVMEEYGASSEAIAFAKLLSEPGYLEQFQEMGKIDLGSVIFPARANTLFAYHLLNGDPPLVSTEIPRKEKEELMKEIKQDPFYPEMKEKYPNILFWGYSAQFDQKKVLPNNNERFVFIYRFVNGCRACDTEYSAKIGFDFDSGGKFLKIIFLEIVK